jgi:glycosyltransferase involved in cell wall biosynthesis
LWRGFVRRNTVSDPVSLNTSELDQREIRGSWGLSPDRRWYAVLGVISERKNLPLVLESLLRLGDAPHTGLLLGGQIDEDVLRASAASIDLLRQSGVKVIIENRLLSEVELDSVVAISHAVVLAHSNEGPSGLLAKSAAAGTFILASGSRSLRRDAKLLPLIAEWDELTVEGVASGMMRVHSRQKEAPALQSTLAGFTGPLLQ